MSQEARYILKKGFKYSLLNFYLFFHESPFSSLERLVSVYLKHDVNATFFIVGSAVKGNLEKLDMLKSQGFELAPHGYIHISYYYHPNPIWDMRTSLKTFKQIGVKVIGFRPPALRVDHDRFKKRMGISLYELASRFGLRYLSSTSTRHHRRIPRHTFEVKEFPCDWSDEYTFSTGRMLSNKEIYKDILPYLKVGKLLLFHGQFSGAKNRISVVDKVLSFRDIDFVSVKDFLHGKKGVILTSDVGSFSRLDLMRRIIRA